MASPDRQGIEALSAQTLDGTRPRPRDRHAARSRDRSHQGHARGFERPRVLVLDESDPKKAIAALQEFGSTQLQRLFGDLFGAETTSRNVMYLRSAISNKGLLDRAAGTPLAAPAEEKKAARNKVVTEAKPKEPRARDPRLPAVGTTIERLYKGEALRVKVLEEGFHFKGTTYPSLSALAKSLTGCSTNGFLFFQLIERPAKA